MNPKRNLLIACGLWIGICFHAHAQIASLNLKMLAGVEITGPIGSTVAVESATNLDSGPWTELTRLLMTNNTQFWIDLGSTNKPSRFYRAVQVTNAVPTNPNPERLVWIPAGAFLMGSPSTEQDRLESEGPQTTVIITKGFWIAKFETTQEEYLAVMGNNPSSFTGDLKRPVEQVLWHEATNYCAKVTTWERAAGRLPDGYLYRLPTEAEWEYACRAGTTTPFGIGNGMSLSSTQANFDGNYPYGESDKGSSLGKTTQRGSYEPNAWGLYDMHGNVWEWCLDWFGAYPGGILVDPRGGNSGVDKIVRGGCWYREGAACRSASRSYDRPTGKKAFIGFRVVLAPSL
jgi:formylglycine-generating enzyme required for sulfatase activity